MLGHHLQHPLGNMKILIEAHRRLCELLGGSFSTLLPCAVSIQVQCCPCALQYTLVDLMRIVQSNLARLHSLLLPGPIAAHSNADICRKQMEPAWKQRVEEVVKELGSTAGLHILALIHT